MGHAVKKKRKKQRKVKKPSIPEKKKEPENVIDSLLQRFDHLEVEIGYGLIPLVDEAQGGDLLERITGYSSIR